MSYRNEVAEAIEEVRYQLEQDGEPDSVPWWKISYRVEILYDEAIITPREEPLLQQLVQTSERLAGARIATEPIKAQSPKDYLPEEIYRQWTLTALVLLSLWNSEPETVELAIALKAQPEALSCIGLSRTDLPLLVQERLLQAPTLLSWFRRA